MSRNLTKQTEIDPAIMQELIMDGDLTNLKSEERLAFYLALCKSLGLNPATQPFQFIKVIDEQGVSKLTIYAKKSCTEQIGANKGISMTDMVTTYDQDCCVVTTTIKDRNDRTIIGTGVVYIKGLVGGEKANAIMKAETKSYRRAVLKYCGLGFPDESELETMNYEHVSPAGQPLIVSGRKSGLDAWKVDKQTAMNILNACKRCQDLGATEADLKSLLPDNLHSRKDLNESQAVEFQNRLSDLQSDLEARVRGRLTDATKF